MPLQPTDVNSGLFKSPDEITKNLPPDENLLPPVNPLEVLLGKSRNPTKKPLISSLGSLDSLKRWIEAKKVSQTK